jgi:hypothetical protein
MGASLDHLASVKTEDLVSRGNRRESMSAAVSSVQCPTRIDTDSRNHEHGTALAQRQQSFLDVLLRLRV